MSYLWYRKYRDERVSYKSELTERLGQWLQPSARPTHGPLLPYSQYYSSRRLVESTPTHTIYSPQP